MVIALTGLMNSGQEYCGGLPRHAQGFRAVEVRTGVERDDAGVGIDG